MKVLCANRARFGATRLSPFVARAARFAADISGFTAIEYGRIIAIVGSAILVLTSGVQSGFDRIGEILADAFSI